MDARKQKIGIKKDRPGGGTPKRSGDTTGPVKSNGPLSKVYYNTDPVGNPHIYEGIGVFL